MSIDKNIQNARQNFGTHFYTLYTNIFVLILFFYVFYWYFSDISVIMLTNKKHMLL